ncbi:hypothetical protein CKO45_10990 [Paracraurococcus ruber]|uniref:Uncharacterized protein n=1 Tax=Paracraurococcus ruber TaxID=77675 RepID=A0ABS1CXT2_9PROT|nr:hypothetical protein [Paracraurococcus ruber]
MLVLPFALLALPAGAAAQAPFRLPDGERMRIVAQGLGWTVLRDAAAPRGAAETGMLLVRAQRPVPAPARPGHLARTLENLRPFRFAPLPGETHLRLGGLPADMLEAPATGQPSGLPVRVRAACVYAPDRSWLLIASAPLADWPGLEPELARLIEGFRPG